MRVYQVNVSPNSSTGNIMHDIANEIINKYDDVCRIAFPFKDKYDLHENEFQMCNRFIRRLNIFFGKIISCEFCLSFIPTIRLIHDIKKFNPDLIHLHNLHSYYINIFLFFSFLKQYRVPVVWTFHDCWPITGHCPHFIGVGCFKWKEQCFACPQKKEYPYELIDTSRFKYLLKKHVFSSLDDYCIVTPSFWLNKQVDESFLRNKKSVVINNGIDLTVFHPTYSDFRNEYNLQDKCIILGVSARWDRKKGFDIFLSLSKIIPDNYIIVLVGTDKRIDTMLPSNIISIHKTSDRQELAKIYTAADIFFNPSREDTFPTVNIEALACGTPVVTFNVGGSPEILDTDCGIVLNSISAESALSAILTLGKKDYCIASKCVLRSKRFNAENRINDYVCLYRKMIDKKYNC